MSRFLRARATFVEAESGRPLHGERYSVHLYDQDGVEDDLLGQGGFIGSGVVEVVFALSAASSWDSPHEEMPDLYLVLYDATRPIFRTPVTFNVQVPQAELFTQQVASVLDLGVFRVPQGMELIQT